MLSVEINLLGKKYMLEYERIDMPEEIDGNKTKESHRCFICNYYYFLNINFRFQSKTCDGCHDLKQKAISFNDVAIVFVKGIDYRIHFWYTSKDEVTKILKNSNLKDKSGTYKINFF